jgi:hypothetical protein
VVGVSHEQRAAEFVESYGRAWERWDLSAFVELFSHDVIYVEHPNEEPVVGHEQLLAYITKEQEAEGNASVRMGRPIVDGNHVVAEFWASLSDGEGKPAGTVSGCFIADLDPETGKCAFFRQYWFEFGGQAQPFSGWGS